tara:strand:- start:452 stop:658 length:207 start_codon:yes stop_codon:yes gene_type:complete
MIKLFTQLTSLFGKVDVNEAGETVKGSLQTRRIFKTVISISVIGMLSYLVATGMISEATFIELFKEIE